jgi:hypothetical protein
MAHRARAHRHRGSDRAGCLKGGLSYKRRHAAEGCVPGGLGEDLVYLRQPRAIRACHHKRGIARVRKSLGALGQEHTWYFAVTADDIDDLRSDHWTSCGQILRGLGRADEARGLVQREWHERSIPAREISGKVGVGLLTEIMNVGSPWQFIERDFCDWS